MCGRSSKGRPPGSPSTTSTRAWIPATSSFSASFPSSPSTRAAPLHEKITRGLVDLFTQAWPTIKAGANSRTPQDHTKATVHRKAELAEISRIDLDRRWPARDLINLLRARTYPPYPGAYVATGERRTYLRIHLRREAELPAPTAEQRAPVQIDLSRQYRGQELLDMLLARSHSPQPSAYFDDATERIYARVDAVAEQDISTQASPRWMLEGVGDGIRRRLAVISR